MDKKELKKRIVISTIIIFLTLSSILVYKEFFYIERCLDMECYRTALTNCKKASFIREDSSSAWKYEILEKEGKNSCKVRVTLLKYTKGGIDAEQLLNKNMLCTTLRYGGNFPEKDLQKCTGELKERIQEIIIERLHTYIVENIKEIKEQLENF